MPWYHLHQDEREVELRISKAWNRWRELRGVCDKRIPAKLKVLIYKTAIGPALLYGNKTWPLTEWLAEKVNSCEMRMLHYCLQISLLEHQKNEEIRQKVNIMPILNLMRKRLLEWFGHVCRRENEDDIQKIYELKMEGNRKRGRPKQIWKDTIEKDLKWCGLNQLDTEDRVQWKNLVEVGIRQKPATQKGHSRDGWENWLIVSDTWISITN